MGKHRKPTKKWAPYVTAGVALEAATLFGLAYAGTGHMSAATDLLATSIFVDGTKSITGNEDGIPPYRMADSFQGRYSDGDGTAFDEQFVMYPRSLGPATGFGDPTYDESEGIATDEVVKAVRAAKNDDGYAGQTIYVVGYSQGAGAAVKAIDQLEQEGLNENVEFVLAANPRRNDGGILARVPGVYLPVFGVTFGDGTTPESTDVVQVTKRYDGVGDAPNYVFNLASDANAVLGYYYLHGDYYKDVDPTPDPTRTDAVVTKTADGRVTDVLINNPDGQLPLTRPLLQLGIPQNIVSALDPFLRSVIETGYNRPTDPNSYPSEPVRFQLVPPPQKWLSDVTSVATGALQTTQRLATLGTPAPAPVSVDEEDASAKSSKLSKHDEESTRDDTNKVEPPKHNSGGWKPGDLLHSIFGPKPKDHATTESDAPSTPEPSKPDTNDSANTSDANAGSSASAASASG